ncbi:MAG: element excision factor XisI family protein [Blastocatellia bacterium]
MDKTEKVNEYKRICRQIVERHAAMLGEPASVESLAVCDHESGNYLLMDIGWYPKERAHYVTVHLRIKDGKVWVEYDGIEYGIAQDLIEAGIPEEDIAWPSDERDHKKLAELVAA